ncbi:MAG: hypothetical protein A6F72_09200 [Cycloclasticus sp. symbiont of Poecilosclerida sp. N]|nr:MAG: hypothetical protein A6F72_09200 [Cycloclasticus sp. symbiont of Poecilosclerida sp. N]
MPVVKLLTILKMFIQEVKEKLGIKFSDLAVMEVDPNDFIEGKISVGDFKQAYVKVIKKKSKMVLQQKKKFYFLCKNPLLENSGFLLNFIFMIKYSYNYFDLLFSPFS